MKSDRLGLNLDLYHSDIGRFSHKILYGSCRNRSFHLASLKFSVKCKQAFVTRSPFSIFCIFVMSQNWIALEDAVARVFPSAEKETPFTMSTCGMRAISSPVAVSIK